MGKRWSRVRELEGHDGILLSEAQRIWYTVPDAAIGVGHYIYKIGRKYVYVSNAWEGERDYKIRIINDLKK